MKKVEGGAQPGAPRWVVLKFGGTSVSSPERWAVIRRVLEWRIEEGVRVLVVHSALSGVSDLLTRIAESRDTGERSDLLAGVLDRHETFIDESGIGKSRAHEVHGYSERAGELRTLVERAGGRALDPAERAELLSYGELLSTTLSTAWLSAAGIEATWVDARDLLTSKPVRHRSRSSAYLSAECDAASDPELDRTLRAHPGIVLTQGFIASDPSGETVLLGRGGSDTSAAYFAGKLDAERIEIWTDVPGIFSADPRIVPGARHLRAIGYREAQEIATSGSKVLHPRCIPALRDRGIPIHVLSTLHPEEVGTVISSASVDSVPHLKAISCKKSVILVAMETVGMWQQVGFLSDVFAVFKAHGLSIDLVSTSETNVTVSLDADANGVATETLSALLTDLSAMCQPRLIAPCAAISLVGAKVRALLHRLAPALELFQEHRVHLVAQAANDLNFTFVVDEDQADRLVKELHRILIGDVVRTRSADESAQPDSPHGGTWQQRVVQVEQGAVEDPWWVTRRDDLMDLMEGRDAAYVYDTDTVARRASALRLLESIDRVFYAVKANPHPALLDVIREHGLGLECVSSAEVRHALRHLPGLDQRESLFTPNFAPRTEYAEALERGMWVTLDSLHPLRHWPTMFAGKEIIVRLDPGVGQGHHEKVRTAGVDSKFGVPREEWDELIDLVRAAGTVIAGVHTHSGSGVVDAGHWAATAAFLLDARDRFPDLRLINVGGGLSVPTRVSDPALDLQRLDRSVGEVTASHSDLEVWMEPGRFVVAEAGVLIARVTQTKGKEGTTFVGLTTGMNSLIRPALYGAYHPIVNLTRFGEPADRLVDVVGPICESGDRLGTERYLPETEEGDLVLIANAGAYGRVMGSSYNLREPAEEIVL